MSRCVRPFRRGGLVLLIPLVAAVLAAGRDTRAASEVMEGLGSLDGVPTFSRDVAPILFDNCAVCHRPGAIGPFPLLSYGDVRKRAKLIAEVTEDRQMPPWKPQPGHGQFLDERRLTNGQVATLRLWADAGAPEGDRADLPPVPQFKDGWKLGAPDLVLQVPEPFTVPAEGQDVFMHFVFPLNLPGERYLRGVEIRPGNARVFHHSICTLDGTGTARRLDAEDPGPGYARLGVAGVPTGEPAGAYLPGMTPRFYPGDVAKVVPPGTDLVFQVHYHPSGKLETDQSLVGLYFTDRKPTQQPGAVILGTNEINIPAGEKAYKITHETVVWDDIDVTDVNAHMHLLGKSVRVWAEVPGGQTVPMLKIDDWDFRWQDVYRYAKPFRLPKGAVVCAEWVYDNSADNPCNPFSPPRRVLYGEEATNEMAGVVVGGLVTGKGPRRVPQAPPVAQFPGALWLNVLGVVACMLLGVAINGLVRRRPPSPNAGVPIPPQ